MVGDPLGAPPSGLVTFCFTDIEGSTKLFHELGDAYRPLLAQHHAIVRDAIVGHHGYEVKTEGDAFFVAFPDPVAAVRACAEVQLALEAHAWPPGARIRVRIGLHSAQASPIGQEYVSLDVHRTARIVSAGHGGQVLLSQETAELVAASLGELGVTDLGAYRLKDFDGGQRLFGLSGEGLPTGFPPLRVPPAAQHNLPRQRTSFVGRTDQVAALLPMVPRSPLLTLLGPGGAGKTRLALELAERLVPVYDDGVWFVDLAAVTDPALVAGSVGAVLGVAQDPGRSMTEAVAQHLRSSQAIIVLDNCEQVIEAAADLVDAVLLAAPDVRVLATSREALQVRGEQCWPLAPLSLPDPDDTGTVLDSESAQLFVERTHLVRPGWVLSRDETPALAAICAALDGLPLALELAAARMASMGLTELVGGLTDRFSVLVGGSRSDLPRQRTLRALIDWSVDLLSEDERTAFARLSVFRGGFTLDAARHVVGTAPLDTRVVETCLESLVAKSLVETQVRQEGTRYRMLVSIRAYAEELLDGAADADEVRARQLAWVLEITETAEAAAGTPGHGASLDVLEQEHDNLRAAQDYALGRDATAALRVAYGVADFRIIRGHVQEAWAALRAALARAAEAQPVAVAYAQLALGKSLAENDQSDGEGRVLLQSALDGFRVNGEQRGELAVLIPLAEDIRCAGQLEAGHSLLLEALALAAARSDSRSEALAHIRLGYVTVDLEQHDAAQMHCLAAMRLASDIGDRRSYGIALHCLSTATWAAGDAEASGRHALEALAVFRSLGDRRSQALVQIRLASAVRVAGDEVVARAHLQECLTTCQALHGFAWMPEVLLELACLEVRRDPATAACLLGMAGQGFSQGSLGPHEARTLAEGFRLVEAQLGPAAEDHRRHGAALGPSEALASALRISGGVPSALSR